MNQKTFEYKHAKLKFFLKVTFFVTLFFSIGMFIKIFYDEEIADSNKFVFYFLFAFVFPLIIGSIIGLIASSSHKDITITIDDSYINIIHGADKYSYKVSSFIGYLPNTNSYEDDKTLNYTLLFDPYNNGNEERIEFKEIPKKLFNSIVDDIEARKS